MDGHQMFKCWLETETPSFHAFNCAHVQPEPDDDDCEQVQWRGSARTQSDRAQFTMCFSYVLQHTTWHPAYDPSIAHPKSIRPERDSWFVMPIRETLNLQYGIVISWGNSFDCENWIVQNEPSTYLTSACWVWGELEHFWRMTHTGRLEFISKQAITLDCVVARKLVPSSLPPSLGAFVRKLHIPPHFPSTSGSESDSNPLAARSSSQTRPT